MSAPVLDQSRAPVDLPVAEQAAGLNFLAIVRRRWPWVLVGLFIGVVGGLLAYTARPAVYQSNAQVIVVKNRTDDITTRDVGRSGYMEDYMSSQVTIIRSEKVLTNAANRIPSDLRSPFPPEIPEKVRLLTAMFTAAREKDPNSPVSMNNIMNVSMKGANPDDAQKVLEIIIEAYRDELRGMYDDATKRRMSILEAAINSQRERVEVDKREHQKTSTAMNTLTQESPDVMRARYSKNIELEGLLKQEQRDTAGWLTQIKKVEKADKRERQKLLMRTGQYFKGQNPQFGTGRYDPNDPNTMLQEVEAALAEQSKKYGPDHPTIQSLEARRDFLRKQAERLNPLDPEGKQDGVDQFEAFLQGRRDTINENLDALKNQIAADSEKLKDVLPMQTALENLTRNIQDRQKKIEEYESERTNTDLTRASGGYEAKTLNTPSRDIAPVAPKLNQSLLLGMAAGLLFGVGLAALAELSDKGFRSPADIRARLGLPVIGHIPPIRTNLPAEDQLDLEPTVVAALRPKSVEAEAYRGVRTALYFNAAGSTHQMIQVTSPSQGDGKSTLAANLAVSIAQSGKRTLLVDCDMRRPRVHRVFHLADPGPGLAAVINGTVPLSGAILRTPVENLSLLPCGKKPSNPAELLTSPNFPDLLDRLKSDYDYVILDTPPVLAVSDPSAVAPRADGVILVFRMTSKVRPAAERAREQLQQIGANVLGVVVNGSGRSDGGYGYGYGGEYTGYSHDQQYMDNYAHEDEDETPPKKG